MPTQQLTTLAQITGDLGSAADCLQGDRSQAVHLPAEWLHTSATEPLQTFLSLSLPWRMCSEVPQLDEVWQGRLRVAPTAQHIMVRGEEGECCHKREQITTWLAHSFHECSHGLVRTEIGSASTLLSCVLCRARHILSSLLAAETLSPSDSCGWQRQRSAQSADRSCAQAAGLLLLQFPVQGRTVKL